MRIASLLEKIILRHQTACDRFIEKKSRTRDQMVQAARSGKQNILEGSQASGASKERELSPFSRLWAGSSLPVAAWSLSSGLSSGAW
jgi:hypothetical protein